MGILAISANSTSSRASPSSAAIGIAYSKRRLTATVAALRNERTRPYCPNAAGLYKRDHMGLTTTTEA